MFCLNCSTQNIEEANYCRKCGNGFQKTSSHPLPAIRNPNHEKAFKKLFIGIGFLVLSSMLSSSVKPFSVILLVVGIITLIKGARLLAGYRWVSCSTHPQMPTTPFNRIQKTSSQRIQTNSQVKRTGELIPPPSVTERTTKLFDRQ
jgi:hypothetical protein